MLGASANADRNSQVATYISLTCEGSTRSFSQLQLLWLAERTRGVQPTGQKKENTSSECNTRKVTLFACEWQPFSHSLARSEHYPIAQRQVGEEYFVQLYVHNISAKDGVHIKRFEDHLD
jgi:hypothetical protein